VTAVKTSSDPVKRAGVLDLDGAVLALETAWPFPSSGNSKTISRDPAVPEAIRSWAETKGMIARSFSMGYKQVRRFQLPCVLEVNPVGSTGNLCLVIESVDDDVYTFVAPDGRREQAPLGNLDSIWHGRTTIFSPALPNKRPLTIGATGKNVRKLQAKLRQLGYPIKNVDGRFGQSTRKALRQFQKDFRLEPDGIHGPRSMAVLYQLEEHHVNSARNVR